MTADGAGGVWTYALELIDALASLEVEVTLATMGSPLRPDQRQALRESSVAAARAKEVKLEWMEDPWDDVHRAGQWLLRLRDEVQPDVVHLNGYVHGALPWEVPAVVVGHSCVLSWFRAVRGEPAPPAWSRYREAVTEGLRGAHALAAPSRAMLRELEHLYEPACERVVIPNGRRVVGVDVEKEPLVLAAGRVWDEAKNIAALDRVAPLLPWPVLVAGELDPRRELRHARALGVLPPRALARVMARASVFVAPARYEPFGYGPLEAAQHGCALVLGDVPSLREIWEDDAFFVDPDADEALAVAIRLLADEEPLRRELAARARARALRYTPERMARDYARLYERATADRVQPEEAVA
jgi:glycosyltransferase involved in cell wall biosynthesis